MFGHFLDDNFDIVLATFAVNVQVMMQIDRDAYEIRPVSQDSLEDRLRLELLVQAIEDQSEMDSLARWSF